MQVVVRPAAAADIDEAFLWYEGQRSGLGHEFLAAAQTLIDALARYPLRYPVVRRDTRRALLRRFPYAVDFRTYDEVVVLSSALAWSIPIAFVVWGISRLRQRRE